MPPDRPSDASLDQPRAEAKAAPRRGGLFHRAAAWDSERLFFEGDDCFDAMEREIDAARFTVDLETYIFANDEIGARFARALADAAQRGVDVRLLVDGVGSAAWLAAGAESLAESGVEIRVFHPISQQLLSSRLLSPASRHQRFFAFLRTLLRTINRRDHRKVCTIDGRAAYVGSLNISGDHARSVKGDLAWRDTAVRVEGDAIWELSKAFDHAWRRSFRLGHSKLRPTARWSRRKLHLSSRGLVRLNNRLRLRQHWYRDLLHRIKLSERRVWLANAYFVPGGKMRRALIAAARGGTDVRILVPGISDHFFMPWVSSAFYYPLYRAGVRLFEFKSRMMHSKTVIIDQWASVGSSNLNSRSLKHDLEADVVLNHASSLSAMEESFVQDLAASKEIAAWSWKDRPWYQQILARVALRLKYWI